MTARRPILPGGHYVTSYGALGNGTDDDTAAIVAAFAAVPAGGGTVVFPPTPSGGAYMVSASLNPPGGTTLLGFGAGSKLKAVAELNDSVVEVLAQNDVTLRDVVVDGNRAAQTGGIYGEALVRVNGAARFSLLDVEVKNGYSHGVGQFDACSDMLIRGCRLHDVGKTALHINGSLTGLVCEGNQLYDWAVTNVDGTACPAFAIWATLGGNENFSVTGNVFRGGATSEFAIESSGSYGPPYNLLGGSFTGNVFDGAGADGAGISGMFFDTVFANNIHRDGGGSHRSGYELVGTDLIAIGNRIDAGAIRIAGASGLTARVLVAQNIVATAEANGKGIAIGGGAAGLSDIVVDGNYVKASGTGAVHGINVGAYGASAVLTGVRIINNRIYDGTSNAEGIGLHGAAGSSDITVRGNRVSGCYQGLYVPADTNHDEVTVEHNDFRGNVLPISNNATGGTYRVRNNVLVDNEVAATVTDLPSLLTALEALGIVVDGT